MDEYSLLSELGSGITSTVFLGINNRTKEKVAIKVIKNKTLYIRTALNEIDILSYLSEEGTQSETHVRLIGSTETNEETWIITEFLSGGDMINYADEFRESSLNNKIKVLRNMAQCIVDIHHKGVAHRDIKLENLIIDRGTLKVKLIDFGTSCLINAGKHLQLKYRNITACSAPAIFGTYDLLSPEVYKKYTQNGRRNFVIQNYLANDIYALGVTFFDLFDEAKYIFDIYEDGNFENIILDFLRFIDMIRYNPEDRSSIDEVIDRLEQLYNQHNN